MAKVTAVDNPSIVLWIDTDARVVCHEMRKYVCGKDLRSALDAGVELFKKYGATKWLSDDRKGGALPPEDVEWSKTNWKPRVVGAGWKHWALILPSKVIGQMSMNQLVSDYAKAGVTVRLFSEPEAGMQWLKNV